MSDFPKNSHSKNLAVAAVVKDAFPVERDADPVIDCTTDATGLTGIIRTTQKNTVVDEGHGVSKPSDVMLPEDCPISNETDTAQAQGDSR